MEAKSRIFKSEDEQKFEVEVESLKLSKFLNDLIIDFPDENDEITINEVNGKNLKLITDFLNHYKDGNIKEIPKPLPSGDLQLYLDEWDYNFIKPLSLEELHRVRPRRIHRSRRPEDRQCILSAPAFLCVQYQSQLLIV